MTIREKVKNYLERRRAINELSSLDDRTLSDLGVSRHNVRAAVDGRR